LLGFGLLGGVALAAVFWNLIAALILGVPIGGWLLFQVWGELELEWECRRPVKVDWQGEQVIQEPSAALVPVRFNSRRPNATSRPRRFNSRRLNATPAPRMLHPRTPIIAQAEIIEVKRP
jgi:hypothetical protein